MSFSSSSCMHLVIDRFPEFRKIAKENGITVISLNEIRKDDIALNIDDGKDGGRNSKKKSSFMSDFFSEVRLIQEEVHSVKSIIREIGTCTDLLLNATTTSQEKEAQDKLDEIIQNGNMKLKKAKTGLEELQKKKTSTASEERVKENMCNSLAKKLQNEVLNFQQSQSVFSKEMKNRTARHLKITCPDASNDDIEEMIQNGETRDAMVQRQLAGSHAVLLENLQQVHEKYQAIRKLEKSMAELHQMFVDMAQLVEHQGEILDVIEVNVSKTRDYTSQAEKELITTRKAQWQSHKRLCCITVVMLIIVVIVIFPVLFGGGGTMR